MGRGALHIVNHNLIVYGRHWRGSITGLVLMPICFLAAMGFGLGSLVNRHGGGIGGVPYLVYIAPGLLAANAMQAGSLLSTYPIMGKVRWEHTYDAVLATPASVADVVVGELAWIALRALQGAAVFAAAMVLFRAVRSPWLLLAIPVAMLTCLAFAAPIMAFSAAQRTDAPFALLQRFVILPLFLFAGAFFPLSQLPGVLQVVAWVLPLWHGVALARASALGTLTLGPSLLHVGVLAAYTLAGAIAALVVMRRKLTP